MNIAVITGDPRKPDPRRIEGKYNSDDHEDLLHLHTAMVELEARRGYKVRYLDNHDTLLNDLQKLKAAHSIDLAVNFCDEGFDNRNSTDVCIPALLEILQLPFTGSGSHTISRTGDKNGVRGMLQALNVSIPRFHYVQPGDNTLALPFPFPALVKPNSIGGSVGITADCVAHDAQQLQHAVAITRERFGAAVPVPVEEFLTGREFSMGMLGNPDDGYTVLPLLEVDFSVLPEGTQPLCGWESKWDYNSEYANLFGCAKQAHLEPAMMQQMVDDCVRMARHMQIHDYLRVDWRLDVDGQPRMLDVNPNSSWCWNTFMAEMAEWDGIFYADLLDLILQAALKRYKLVPSNVS